MSQSRNETVAGAEQTIALILAQELQCSSPFATFFVRKLLSDLMIEGTLGEAEVRIARFCGAPEESWDLSATVGVGPMTLSMLLAVRFGHRAVHARQAKAAAKAVVDRGEASLASAIWVTTHGEAARTGEGEPIYDRVVSLESILKELKVEAACSAYELQRRREFHVMLIERAIRAAETAADESAADGGFWAAYCDFISDAAPELIVDAARMAPPGASMLAFDAETMPAWPFMPPVRLAHHLREGVASILIHDWGEHIEGLAEVMQPALEGTRYHLAQDPSRLGGARSGALIVADTPPIDPGAPFDGQRRQAQRCVAEIRDLRSWFVSRRSIARYWADFVSPTEPVRKGGRIRRNVRLS